MQLQQTSSEQLDNVTACHLLCFNKSFAAKVGFSYAKKTLEWFLVADNRFLFHITDNGEVIGYCGGFQSKGAGDGSTSGMIQYAMKEAVSGMIKKPWLLFHKDIIRFYPLIIRNIYRKIVPKKNAVIVESSTRVRQIGLVVIGVHPSFRGQGYFEMLMNYFEQECTNRRAQRMILSVRADNTRAIAAYQKAGWIIGKSTDKAMEMYKDIAGNNVI